MNGDDQALLPGTPAERAAEAEYGLSVISPDELPLLPGEERSHPSPFQYVIIFVILCVITALEIGLYYLEGDLPWALIVGLLLVMAFIKFVMVASWFMHLRTDKHDLPALLHHGRVRGRLPLHDRPHDVPRLRLSGTADGCVVPRLAAPPRRPPARRPARRRLRDRAHPGRAPVPADRRRGREPLPGDLLRARRVRDAARGRVADARPRRGLHVQRPHGAAPAAHDGRGAAAAARDAGLAAPLAPPTRVALPIGALARPGSSPR